MQCCRYMRKSFILCLLYYGNNLEEVHLESESWIKNSYDGWGQLELANNNPVCSKCGIQIHGHLQYISSLPIENEKEQIITSSFTASVVLKRAVIIGSILTVVT